jgi:UDP-N-acetylmuramate--alanine ligase
VVDDYGHNPTELRAALETARPRTTGRLVAVYVPHVVERTRHLYRELGEALGLADVAIVTDFVGRRDAPREGVSGRLVLDAVPEPTRRIWAPTLEDAAGLALRVLRPGDMVVTLGVGEPWRAARAIVDGLPGPDES